MTDSPHTPLPTSDAPVLVLRTFRAIEMLSHPVPQPGCIFAYSHDDITYFEIEVSKWCKDGAIDVYEHEDYPDKSFVCLQDDSDLAVSMSDLRQPGIMIRFHVWGCSEYLTYGV